MLLASLCCSSSAYRELAFHSTRLPLREGFRHFTESRPRGVNIFFVGWQHKVSCRADSQPTAPSVKTSNGKQPFSEADHKSAPGLRVFGSADEMKGAHQRCQMLRASPVSFL